MTPDITQAIHRNIDLIRAKIAEAAKKSDRNPGEIMLLGVTKTVETDIMRVALDYGLKEFGENRVQEYIRKSDILNKDVNWHIIGRLQTNKVKYLDNRITLIHSLDRMELATALQMKGSRDGLQWNVLVQVNVSGEDSKSGIEPENLKKFVMDVSKLGNIHIKGLMTVAPYSENPEDIRWVFNGLKKLAVDIAREKIENMSMEHLSMGMSNDFEVAISEGATIIRVGSALFGERVYTP